MGLTKTYNKLRTKERKIYRESLSIHFNNLTTAQRKSARIQLFIKQDGCCRICGKPEKDMKRKLHLDHCHITGHIRGLLCNACNLLLGIAKDNVYTLQSAERYLQESTELRFV